MERLFEIASQYLERKLYNLRTSRFLSLNNMNKDKYKVLVVEDDKICAKYLDTFFQQHHCQTRLAFDEKEAIKQLVKHKNNLVILDWMLPHLNGGEIIRQADELIKNDNKMLVIGRTPVITFSGLEQKEIKFPQTSYFLHLGHIHKLEAGGSAKNTMLSMLLNIMERKGLQFA